MTLELAINQPWTIHVAHDAENGYVVTVEELPDAIATADDPRDVSAAFWQAIRASIAARLEFGLPIPTPRRSPGARLPDELPLAMFPVEDQWTAAMFPVHVLQG